MAEFNQAFKMMQKEDFFKILKINPNAATIKYNHKDENKEYTLKLTQPKFLQTLGSDCSVCDATGRYFIFYKNGDVKLFALSDFGSELEISIFNRKPYCSACKGIKTSRLNSIRKKVK